MSLERAAKAHEIHAVLMLVLAAMLEKQGAVMPDPKDAYAVERAVGLLVKRPYNYILVDASRSGPTQLTIATSWKDKLPLIQSVAQAINEYGSSVSAEMKDHELVLTYQEEADVHAKP